MILSFCTSLEKIARADSVRAKDLYFQKKKDEEFKDLLSSKDPKAPAIAFGKGLVAGAALPTVLSLASSGFFSKQKLDHEFHKHKRQTYLSEAFRSVGIPKRDAASLSAALDNMSHSSGLRDSMGRRMDLKLQHALAVALPAKNKGILPSTDIFSKKMSDTLSKGLDSYIASIDPKNSTFKDNKIKATNHNRTLFLHQPRDFAELKPLPEKARNLGTFYHAVSVTADRQNMPFSPFSEGPKNPLEELYRSVEQKAATEDIANFKSKELPKALLPTFKPKDALDADMFDSLVHAGRELYKKRTGGDISSKAFSNKRLWSALKGGVKGSALFGILGGSTAAAGVLSKRKELESLGAKNDRR